MKGVLVARRELTYMKYLIQYCNRRTNAIDHNNYVVDNYVFQANYRAGLEILEINNLQSEPCLRSAAIYIINLFQRGRLPHLLHHLN